MTRTILLTGATDGIGYETAKRLVADGHTVLVHGRSADKLARTLEALTRINAQATVRAYRADLSSLADVDALAESVAGDFPVIDVLINNAGVFKTPHTRTTDGYDVRFVVNTLAPYRLTMKLLAHMPTDGRVVNLSSAAQAPVDVDALLGRKALSDSAAYAQSKLAITMWSFHLAKVLGPDAPAIIAVNPASLLGSKMVKEAYGTPGKDIGIGAQILVEAALDPRFADATGRYFDNDRGQFASPHPDALDPQKNQALVALIDDLVAQTADA
ncbi:MAG: SDR family NAD(P)-dependent oxidoreductase [Pseudomonadota bacterium]